jgi:hypothetical protein
MTVFGLVSCGAVISQAQPLPMPVHAARIVRSSSLADGAAVRALDVFGVEESSVVDVQLDSQLSNGNGTWKAVGSLRANPI